MGSSNATRSRLTGLGKLTQLRIRVESALELEHFLVTRDTQLRIAEYGRERFGRPLFRPLALAPESAAGVD